MPHIMGRKEVGVPSTGASRARSPSAAIAANGAIGLGGERVIIANMAAEPADQPVQQVEHGRAAPEVGQVRKIDRPGPPLALNRLEQHDAALRLEGVVERRRAAMPAGRPNSA